MTTWGSLAKENGIFHESQYPIIIMSQVNATERRRSARIDTMENEIVLEWQESRKHSSEGTIINVSEGGALILSDSPVQLALPVLIRLKAPINTDWVAARVVRRGKNNELGLAFTDTCPPDFKLAATMGIDFKGLFGLSDAERFSHSGD